MKSNKHLLAVYGLFIALLLVQYSCGSSKKSAVPCPDFSRSRNMKSRHAQLKNIYPDQQQSYRSNSARVHHPWFKGTSKAAGGINITVDLYSGPVSAQTGIGSGNSGGFSYIQPAGAELVSMVIPIEKIQKAASPVATDNTESTKRPEKTAPGCDTIVLRNGDIMEARVLEIGQREIRYRKCEDIQGPVFVVNLIEVFMIKYPNGTRDYFTSERSPASSLDGTAPKKTEGMALAGFIGSLVGLFVLGIPLGIMAFVFGFVSIGKIDRHPDRYKGRGFAIASIIIGAVDVIGMLIVLAAM